MMKRRLARLRRIAPGKDENSWALWVDIRYMEVFGDPTFAVISTPLGSDKSQELGRATTWRKALRLAERKARQLRRESQADA